MLHSSTRKLIDRLAEMTELGKLDWTEGENGAVVYSTEGYSVLLSSAADEVVITSIEGKELERAAASDLATTHTDEGTSYSEIVAEMTKEASRVALGTEAAISTLLAGMDPVVEPSIDEAAEPEPLVEEDPVDESTLVDSVAETKQQAEPETVPEPEVEAVSKQDTELDATAHTNVPVETNEETSAEPKEELVEATELDTETEAPAALETAAASPANLEASDDFDTMESEEVSTLASDEDVALDDPEPVESESDLTEAVARMADEVNGRDNGNEAEAPVADVFGAAAVAASMSVIEDRNEPELDQSAEPEAAEDASLEAAADVSDAETEVPAYIPFGLDAVDSDVGSAPSDEPADIDPTPVSESMEAETAPESLETSEPDPISFSDEPADLDPVSSEADTDAQSLEVEEGETDLEVETQTETEAEPIEFAAAPIAEAVAPAEEEQSQETELAEPEPEDSTVVAFSSMPEADETPELAPAAEPEMEPVLASSDVPESESTKESSVPSGDSEAESEAPTYSLSGIGAGFGLGALAARTEASGIPGPSSSIASEPEKVIIDATDDVLPEAEGQAAFAPLDGSSNGISFGNSETETAGANLEDGADAESDILKPRTRFNPWD